MTEAMIPEAPAETITRLGGKGWTSARILDALGHPGYGEEFAVNALRRIERYGMTSHEAVYGGIGAARKIEAAR